MLILVPALFGVCYWVKLDTFVLALVPYLDRNRYFEFLFWELNSRRSGSSCEEQKLTEDTKSKLRADHLLKRSHTGPPVLKHASLTTLRHFNWG